MPFPALPMDHNQNRNLQLIQDSRWTAQLKQPLLLLLITEFMGSEANERCYPAECEYNHA